MSEQRAVQYSELGGPERLHIVPVPVPTPREGRVRLRVDAVGVNPYDVKVLAGSAPRDAPFPRGICSDAAGTVEQLGEDAVLTDGTRLRPGDRVFGWGVHTLREQLVVRASSVALVPEGLDAADAVALVTPGLAALACLRAVPVTAADTVFVSGASGSVGFIVAQLARDAGARVIGLTGPGHADRLSAAGIVPIVYGERLGTRLRTLLGDAHLTAAIDTIGDSVLRLLHDLGVAPERTATLAGDAAAAAWSVIAPDTAARASADLSMLAARVAAGTLLAPVARIFPLAQTQAAFAEVASGHSGGKVVIDPNA